MKQPPLVWQNLVLYEDEHLVALNKPAGITTLAERNQPDTGLLQWARQQEAQLQACHRLDRQTTGVLLMARTPEAYRSVAGQLEHRQVGKGYLALLDGIADWQEEHVNLPLHTDSKGVVRVMPGGKEAHTVFQAARVYRHHTLMLAQPFTGRQHQIRVHAAYRGHPLVGDATYGGKDLFLSQYKRGYRTGRGEEERPLNQGMLLHCQHMQLTHPATGQPLTLEAPLPRAVQAVLTQLDKHS